MIISIIYLSLILLLNFFITKNRIISSNTGLSHQSFANKTIPLTGGIFILLPALNLFFLKDVFFLYSFFFLFLLGLTSDLNILISAKKRFFLQLFIILTFVIIKKLQVIPTRIDSFDEFIQDTYLSYFFTAFCLMILINGTNFIDGLNGLLIGYFIIIILILYKTNLIYTLDLPIKKLTFFILVILFLFFMNIFNKLFMGDNGAYSLGFLIGFILIEIYNSNKEISPYFIVLLLWYPCFENLFSIIRKILFKINPLKPDTGHLHQKLFVFLKKKFKFSIIKSNILSSLSILLFNMGIFYLSSRAINHTSSQILLLLFSIITYVVLFALLSNKIKRIT